MPVSLLLVVGITSTAMMLALSSFVLVGLNNVLQIWNSIKKLFNLSGSTICKENCL